MRRRTGSIPTKSKKKRPYDSGIRRRQADETREAILVAARQLLLKKGYAGVTIPEIARAAGVAVPTVNAIFGSKKGIVAELLDQARFGHSYQALVQEAMLVRDPAQRLTFAARIARQIYESEMPIQNLLRGAGMLAPELAALENEREGQRYVVQSHLVDYLCKNGALRIGLDRSSACDILWTFTSRDLYRMLVLERGWEAERYEQWLMQALRQMLL